MILAKRLLKRFDKIERINEHIGDEPENQGGAGRTFRLQKQQEQDDRCNQRFYQDVDRWHELQSS